MTGNKIWQKWIYYLFATFFVVITLLIASLALLWARINPLTFWSIIFIKPFTSLIDFSNLLHTVAILLLTGLAVAISFKYRIYNFGVSGQMMFSAMITYVIAIAISQAGGKGQWLTPFLLLIAFISGMVVGLVIALLKTYFKIHEIISTILFNFIAWQGYKGLISSPNYSKMPVPDIANLRFSLIAGPFNGASLFSGALIIALVMLVLAILLFNNRSIGFKLNAIAKNPLAAAQARLNPQYQTLRILPLSAAIAGMAGYCYFLAINSRLPALSHPLEEGFYGIIVAALVNYNLPSLLLSTSFVSFFISAINYNSFVALPTPQIAFMILAITIYLLGCFPFIFHLSHNALWFKKMRHIIKKDQVVNNNDHQEQQKRKNNIVHLGFKDTTSLSLPATNKKFRFKKLKNKWRKPKGKG